MRGSFPPIWLMGLTNAVFGMYSGILVISVPQILSARQVPEATIAAMTGVMMSPGFWAVLVSPILDVRFSRRGYSAGTALLAAVLLFLALCNLDNLGLAEVLLVAGYFFANLYQSALGGWLSSITASAQENTLSVWLTVGNLAGGGVMAAVAAEVAQRFSATLTALLLSLAVLLPVALFPCMPAPPADRRLALESFPQFFAEVISLLKRRDVLIAILLFMAPAATFSLTNFLSGLGQDFHATSRFVGMVAGLGVFVGALCGCFIFPLIDRLMPLRWLYLAIGVVGGLFTLALMGFARTPLTFAVALIGQNVFQALAITASTAITFETIGRHNPLAATTYCLMVSAFNVPITYMLFVDGWGYGLHGVLGSYLADGGVSVAAGIALAVLLLVLRKRPVPAV